MLCKMCKFYMAVWALNIKMTDPLAAAAELGEETYAGQCSREVWGPSESHFSKFSIVDTYKTKLKLDKEVGGGIFLNCGFG